MKVLGNNCPKENVETATYPEQILKNVNFIGYREDGFYILRWRNFGSFLYEINRKIILVEKQKDRRNKQHLGLKADCFLKTKRSISQ